MNFNSIDEIKKAGFSGFKKMGDLFKDSSSIPQERGIYLVLRPDNNPPKFLQIGTGGHYKDRNPNVPIETLKSNWVEETVVVYIGKATSLKTRLEQYFKFGQGKNVGHYGGRFIWQLKDSADLIVCWKQLPNNDDPRKAESLLINDFLMKYSNLPFANLVR
jgi:hypothetical protein